MQCNLANAQKLIEEYNRLYKTSFKMSECWRLFPDKDGVCDFRDRQWPGNGHAGVYLVMAQDGEVIYVGQTLSLGYRFSQYFKNDNGNCVVRSSSWSETPASLVVIEADDDRKYERLSLEEYLIERLMPIDNIRGK